MKIPTVAEAFVEQAEICASMGSGFTAALCRLFAEQLTHETKVGALCLDWSGNPSGYADSIPLRLCGGMHALVLSGRGKQLAKYYSPQSDEFPPWPVIKNALMENECFLLDWMQSPPQTNEVARSAVVWPSLMVIAAKTGLPLRLLEIGASGGLNLQCQHFSYQLGDLKCGTVGSPVRLQPEWKGNEPLFHEVSVQSARGCDLNPLVPTCDEDALRLRSYVWPDQLERNQKMSAALEIARAHPIKVEKIDGVEWLSKELSQPSKGCCTVIYSTIAWQYLPEKARAAGAAIIETAGEQSGGSDAPIAWLRFEADGKSPGGNIHLRLWPENVETSLGRADFHVRWVDWKGFQKG